MLREKGKVQKADLDDLHFQIQDGGVVQQGADIQNEGLFIDGIAKHYGVGDLNRLHFGRRQAQQGTDQSFEDVIVSLQKCAEEK